MYRGRGSVKTWVQGRDLGSWESNNELAIIRMDEYYNGIKAQRSSKAKDCRYYTWQQSDRKWGEKSPAPKTFT